MKYFLLVSVFIFSAVSCTSSDKMFLPPTDLEFLPPQLDFVGDKDKKSLDLQLLKIAAKYPEEKFQWWASYRRARLWENDQPEISCPIFVSLSKISHFPLQQIAHLRSLSSCQGENIKKFNINKNNFYQSSAWLSSLSFDLGLEAARQEKNLHMIFDFALQKSKLSSIYEEKLKFLQECLSVARALNDQEKIKVATLRLYKIAPRFKPNLQPKDFLDVAYDYRQARDFNHARVFYEKVVSSPQFSFSEKVKALKGLRFSFKIEQKKKEYLKATLDLAKFIERFWSKHKKNNSALNTSFHESQILLARTYWTLNQPAAAKTILTKLAHSLNGQYPLDEVFWLKGRMAEEKGNFTEAIEWFRKGLAEIKDNKNSSRERLQWYQAWNLRKLRQYSEATAIFQNLIETSDNEFARSRYTYWLSITQKDAEKSELAKSLLKKLLEEDPMGYYGLLARRELQTPVTLSSSLSGRDSKNNFLIDYPINLKNKNLLDHTFIHWLISVGEKEIAHLYLNHVSNNYRKQSDQNEKDWLTIFQYYSQSGVYLGLYNQLSLLEPSLRNLILNNYPQLIFPTPYNDEVAQASNRYGVSSELIYAIMRQESAFDPNARSPADAFGLMQLLPKVAKNSAEQIKIDFRKTEDLYQPHINIPLGSAYLRALLDKFNGQFILTVASYNASEDAIQNWLLHHYRGNTIEFIEDIPYEETRSYVRLVMRNLIFYSLIVAGEKSIPFPEWTLALTAPSSP